MRVGIISAGSPDYLIDIVTDGMIRLLGRDKVSLDYNVRSGWGGNYAHLLQGFQGPEPFDIHDANVLIASSRSIPQMKAWAKKTGHCRPIAFLDGEDSEPLISYVGSDVKVYFKREYIRGRAYHGNVKPLQFAAIPETLINEIEVNNSVFYSGHETHSYRKEISAVLVSMGFPPTGKLDKLSYNKALMSSLIGIAIRGNGWDTYRYWEIPYFGAALLSQRLGIVIPGDYEEGKEAFFYDSLGDFKAKLNLLLKDVDKTMEMARAGREACMQRHLSIHRAKTVLEAIS